MHFYAIKIAFCKKRPPLALRESYNLLKGRGPAQNTSQPLRVCAVNIGVATLMGIREIGGIKV